MRIAVDAMGGDFAPREIVAGTLVAVDRLPGLSRLFLVGHEDAIRREIPAGRSLPDKVQIVPASEIVGMEESPATAVRRKRDSSISRAVDMVKAGEADAVFSAGNTGAAVAASQLKLRPLDGVYRPAIATVLPTWKEPLVLVDAGANTECTAAMLLQFAVMGAVYSREILGIRSPSVGLLSVGTEDTKGNDTTKEAFALLKQSGLNFAGNVEGHDLYEGNIHVAVCDGFVGNVVLKTSESAAHFMGRMLKAEFTRTPLRKLGALLLKGGIDHIKRRSDPAQYGGAPLLGINGVCIIGHGASNAKAVYNGIRVAGESVNHHISHLITEEIRRLPAT